MGRVTTVETRSRPLMKESEKENRFRIERALKGFANNALRDAAIDLLDVLGYRSDRRIPLTPNSAAATQNTLQGDDIRNSKRGERW